MTSIKIVCICQKQGHHENPFTSIQSMSWVDVISREEGHATLTAMYHFVSSGNVAFVEDADGCRAQLLAAQTKNGTGYVRTAADMISEDKLLRLPKCHEE